MYQLEVKRWLVQHRFHPAAGWKVHVDIDAMERANGGVHRPDKLERARAAEIELRSLGAHVGGHPVHGRVDIVAEHPVHGCVMVEVEGSSSRQKEQAVYSALGQLLLLMQSRTHRFVLAAPDDPTWERQLRKVPQYVRDLLQLSCVLVSATGVRDV